MADDGLTWDSDLIETSESAQQIRAREERDRQKRRKYDHPPLAVAACPTSCPFAGDVARWCDFPVTVPYMQWPVCIVLAAAKEGAIRTVIAETEEQVILALHVLKRSMCDQVLGIDIEWKADKTEAHNNRVSLIQLASSTCAVLIRTCKMKFQLPEEVIMFLTDSEIVLVGFSWSASDEKKMQLSFQMGQEDFGRYLDLQPIATTLGYHGKSIATLARAVLKYAMTKSQQVTLSNWESSFLTQDQITYAVLDALVVGHVLRILRAWHAHPKPCRRCSLALGQPLPPPNLRCPNLSCGKVFESVTAILQHAQQAQHEVSFIECMECGRTVPAQEILFPM